LGWVLVPGDVVTLQKHAFFDSMILVKLRKARVIGRIFRNLPIRFSLPFASAYMVPQIRVDLKSFRILIGNFPVQRDDVYYPFVFQMHKFLALYQPIK